MIDYKVTLTNGEEVNCSLDMLTEEVLKALYSNIWLKYSDTDGFHCRIKIANIVRVECTTTSEIKQKQLQHSLYVYNVMFANGEAIECSSTKSVDSFFAVLHTNTWVTYFDKESHFCVFKSDEVVRVTHDNIRRKLKETETLRNEISKYSMSVSLWFYLLFHLRLDTNLFWHCLHDTEEAERISAETCWEDLYDSTLLEDILNFCKRK